ncbi:hypothetical protein NDU88_006873 [Pleurodeles waltl]|uniref:Uncharacterized protein n=1 Tax=Pleurodeles waltl TaxID=8319 RepID=A0AAV7SQW9_PLEWA|nr:hypothetical protein NDU88_006873 [Pleurodeles waltl]
MELPESKAKKRMLPTWMNETKTDGKECRSKRVKKKKKPLLRSPKKQVVYCMNEAELVEVALEVLNRVVNTWLTKNVQRDKHLTL